MTHNRDDVLETFCTGAIRFQGAIVTIKRMSVPAALLLEPESVAESADAQIASILHHSEFVEEASKIIGMPVAAYCTTCNTVLNILRASRAHAPQERNAVLEKYNPILKAAADNATCYLKSKGYKI